MRLLLSLTFAVVTLFISAAHADTINITQVNTNTTISAGQSIDLEFLLSAPITNTGVFTAKSFYISYYSSVFSYVNDNVRGFQLGPGQSNTQYYVTLTALANAAAGTYTDTYLYVTGSNGDTYSGAYSVTVLPSAAVTPEPASIVLLGTGLLALVWVARSKVGLLSRQV